MPQIVRPDGLQSSVPATTLPVLPTALRVPATRTGSPRTTPDVLLGEKAYPAWPHRSYLRARGVKTVIPEPVDHIGHRRRRGSRGGRPVTLDVNHS